MLMQVNGVVRLVKDPEQRYTSDGKSIVTFSVVSNEKYKETETNCFIDCVVFGTLGEKVVMPYLKKASKIYMQGRLKQDTWQDKDGAKRSKHSISVESFEFLDSKAKEGNEPKIDTDREPDIRIGGRSEVDIDLSEIPF